MGLNAEEKIVLEILFTVYGGGCYNFRGIAEHTGLDRNTIRAACRSLRGKGLARYQAGLFDDEGMTAGSGYSITVAGANIVKEIQATQRAVA